MRAALSEFDCQLTRVVFVSTVIQTSWIHSIRCAAGKAAVRAAARRLPRRGAAKRPLRRGLTIRRRRGRPIAGEPTVQPVGLAGRRSRTHRRRRPDRLRDRFDTDASRDAPRSAPCAARTAALRERMLAERLTSAGYSVAGARGWRLLFLTVFGAVVVDLISGVVERYWWPPDLEIADEANDLSPGEPGARGPARPRATDTR